jgi:cation:H+ antiporter
MAIVLTTMCLLFLLAPIEFTIAGIGPGPLAVAVSYVLGLRLVYYDQQHAMQNLAPGETAITEPGAMTLQHAVIGYAACTVGILVAAPLLASAAEGLAEVTGLGGTFIGTTLVAISTSMPEAVTTYAAVRAGAYDLAVGNIFGSNAFNMVILLPADGFFEGSLLAAASPTQAITATCAILATGLAVLGLLYRPERWYWIVEPDAALVIVVVVASLGLIYYLR